MKRLSLTLFCCFLAAMTALAQFDSAPAFPGAEGYGRYTTGGRGGTVYHVTTLEDYCDNADYSPTKTRDNDNEHVGTLRYAVRKSGARIIVFDVAGTIELKAPLKIQNDNITILGQTAPGDGICLKNYTLGIFANNVIIRYIRCRMGDEGKRYYSNGSALSNTAFEDDAMNAYQKTGSEKRNIIIDHCSISWCVDECGSFYGNENFTLQWCMLSESLRNSVHDKGAHGYGGIWGGSDASFHHNLLAHHDSRMIRFDHDYVSTCKGPVDYVNNVVYNWGSNSTYGGESSNGTYKKFNMINNYYKPGPATKSGVKTRLLNPTTKCDNCTSTSKTSTSTGVVTPGHFYLSGNYMYGSTAVTNDNTCDAAIDPDSNVPYATWKSTCLSNSRFTSSAENHLNMHSAEKAFNNVVSYAGASLKRDNVDTRIANETRNGTSTYTGSNGSTGGLIDTPSDVGGYPTLTGTKALDSDNDGIPDEWEDAHNLNKNDATDALKYTLDTQKGYYTNLEVYANHLVQHITKAERAGATESFVEYYPLDDDPSALLPTTINATPESVSITGTASATVTLSSNNTDGAYSISSNPNSAVATASISGNTVTITGVAAGTTSFTVSQAESSTHEAATKTINITVTAAQGGGDTPATNGELIWNFNSLSTGDIPTGQDFNITATDGKTVMVYVPGSGTASRINASSSISGFTKALYMGGNGNTGSRYLKIPVTGTGTLEITAISNTSGATDNFTIYDGSASGKKLKENFTQGNNNIASSGEITVTNSIMLVCTTKTWYYQIHWIPSTPQPTSVIVSPANKTIEVDGTLQLYAQVLPAGADQSVTWSSSDETIAEVDATGKVTAKATGTVKITARAENGLTDYCVLTVVEKQSGGSGNAIVWDFTQETAQTLTEGETYTFTANDGSTTLTYKAGSGDKIEGTPSYLRENGGTNSAGTRGIFLNVQGQGTLSIYCKDTNRGVYECYNGSASGTKLADYTAYIGNEDPNYTSTVNVTDANGLFIKTTTKGYIYKITWTPTTAPTTQYITKHISSTGWASFVPEKSVVVSDDVDVYYVKSGSYNAFANTVQAVKIPAGTVIKGDGKTGYIVNASEEGDYDFEVSSDEAQSYDENILACGENEPIPNGSLVFACYNGTSGFYALDNYAINLPVGIVYLPASVFTGTGAPRAVTINFDEATVINNSITEQFNNTFFNINGQKVDANYRGIIIRNGRKYINK